MCVVEACTPTLSRSAAPRDSRRVFFGVCALVFAASATVTIVWSARMRQMGAMPMPGGWTLSPMWMRMPGGGWSDAAASFPGTWAMMMIAMMMPSLSPELLRYFRSARVIASARADLLTVQVGVAYFLVLTAAGALVFPLGISIAAVMMGVPALARDVPFFTGVIVVFAGALQFTRWKAHHLACWSNGTWYAREESAALATAWRQGVRLALRCTRCCWPFMAILLAFGTMDIRAMTLVTVAVSLERLVPDAARVVRAIGGVAIAVGLLLIARAAVLA
jgi:predicted metal-binding membrane protein